MTYAPTRESVSTHPLPVWFDNAKLGIFVHWGLYSVPGWAPYAGALGIGSGGDWSNYTTTNLGTIQRRIEKRHYVCCREKHTI